MNKLSAPSSLPSSRGPRRLRPRQLVLALAMAGIASHALWPGASVAHAQTLPGGLNVVQGQAAVKVNGTQMTVTNSAGALLNWQSFSIGAGNSVRFDQPSTNSRVLNRVVGSNPSQIFGSLSSNGEVWLVNPYGVLFGRDARVDVGSLVVSTLNIGNDDWRNGRLSLTAASAPAAGGIVNQGELRSASGGRILLLANEGGVRNEGLIAAPDGQVALAAGQSVDLVDTQTQNLAVRVQAPAGEVLNLGSVLASGGRIDLQAAMVNQQGIVRADSLGGQGGQIVLQGSQGVALAAGTMTSAQGNAGGSVTVDSGAGTTMLAGEVTATGSAGPGGELLVLGRQVGLLDGASADVSGAQGGGRIRVGGGLQGKDASLRNAEAVYMGPAMTLRADAGQRGDGGTIILWSDQATRAYGTLSARGGAQGGNGGFVETSGGWLDARPASVRTDAPKGNAGQWLLDPNNIIISNQFEDFAIAGGPNFTSTDDNASVSPATLAAALMAGNNVTITTGNGGTNKQEGSVFFSQATLDLALPNPVSLTVNAGRDITAFQTTIRSTGKPLDVTFSSANGASGAGAIIIQQSSIETAGGNLTLTGGTVAAGPNIVSPRAGAVGYATGPGTGMGIGILGSTLDAGSGTIRMVGLSTSTVGGTGIYVRDDAQFQTVITGRDIDLFGWVDSNANAPRRGVYVEGPLSSITASHSLKVTGIANSGVFQLGGEGEEPMGVSVQGGTLRVQPTAIDATASVLIDGTVNDAVPAANVLGASRLAVSFQNAGSNLIVAGGASATIIGRDILNLLDNSAAVLLANAAVMDFSAGGAVSIQGNSRVGLLSSVALPLGQTFNATAGDLLRVSGSLVGDPSSLTLTARDIEHFGSIVLGVSAPSAISMNATRDIRLSSANITAMDQPVTISLNAASGGSGAGTIEVLQSSISSNGGDITLGGGSLAAGANISSPRAGAVGYGTGAAGVGVGILGSNVDAGSGKLTLSGQSVSGQDNTYGVLIREWNDGGSTLTARDIDIFGWVDSNAAVVRAGIVLDSFSSVNATHSLKMTGLANSTVLQPAAGLEPTGIVLNGAVTLIPAAPDPTASFSLDGTVNDAVVGPNDPGRVGVLVQGRSAIITVGGGASVSIVGHDANGVAGQGASVAFTGQSVVDLSDAGAATVMGDRLDLSSTLYTPTGQSFSATATDLLSMYGSILGDATSVSLTGRDIFLAGQILLAASFPTTLAMTATRDIRLSSAFVGSQLQPLDVSLRSAAGASGTGSIELLQSNVSSLGGNIDLGGGSQATGPNLTSPRAGAVGTGSGYAASGVSVMGSTLDAGAGSLRITGASVSPLADANGVLIAPYGESSSQLLGRDIDIFGWVDSNAAFRRTGVRVDNSSTVAAGHALSITGVANSSLFQLGAVQPIGVDVAGALLVQPAQADPTASLTITGSTNDALRTGPSPARAGVSLASVNASVIVDGGAKVDITGNDLSPNADSAVAMTAGTFAWSAAGAATITGNTRVDLGGTLTVPTGQAFQVTAGGIIDLGNGAISGSSSSAAFEAGNLIRMTGGLNFSVSGPVSLRAKQLDIGAGSAFTLNSDGAVSLFADTVNNGAASTITSNAVGTSIVLAGYDRASNVGSVTSPDATQLSAPNGRWLYYTADDFFGNTTLGYAFRQFGSTYPTAIAAAGNGLVFAAAPVVTLRNGNAITKVYDGGTAVTTANPGLALSGQQAGTSLVGGFGAPTLSYTSKDAAVGVAISVAGFAEPSAVDAQGKPVFGYTYAFDVRGDITPRGVSLSGVLAADKVYDGSRVATLSGGVLANLVAEETLGLSYSAGRFDTANVGVAKAVTGNASLTNATGLAANYQLVDAVVTTSAQVLPATLLYLAQPVTLQQGVAPVNLGGQVNGFIEGETQANATTGNLLFTTPATASSVPGTYAVAGSGLVAINYVFAQAPGNAQALTIVEAPPAPPAAQGDADLARLVRSLQVRSPRLMPVAQDVRVLDVFQGLRFDADDDSVTFGAVDLSEMSREDIAAMLEARNQYKQAVLREGRRRLELDPSLADAPACASVRQAANGTCLVTEDLLARAEAEGVDATALALASPLPSTAAAPQADPGAPNPVTPIAAVTAPPRPTVNATPAAPEASPAAVPGPAAVAADAATAPATAAATPTAAAAEAVTAGMAEAKAAPRRVRPVAHPVLVPPPIPALRSVRTAVIPQIRRKLAVLVGIDNYADDRIPSLDNAGRDAEAVAAVLEGKLGYQTIVVRDAGREAILGVLNKLALQARPNDSIVVYYAGHGTVLEDSGRGYWIPANADAARPETWISNTDVDRVLGSIRASQVVLISDSCFSGNLVSDRSLRASANSVDAQALLRRRAAVVMSSGGNEPVADGSRDGHSPFAASLLTTLQGLDAWRPGSNVFSTVYTEVTRQMPQTPRYGPARQGRHADGADYLFEQRQLDAAAR